MCQSHHACGGVYRKLERLSVDPEERHGSRAVCEDFPNEVSVGGCQSSDEGRDLIGGGRGSVQKRWREKEGEVAVCAQEGVKRGGRKVRCDFEDDFIWRCRE